MKYLCIASMLAVVASMVAGCDQKQGYNIDTELAATKAKYVELGNGTGGKLACGVAVNVDMGRMSISCDHMPTTPPPTVNIQTPVAQPQ